MDSDTLKKVLDYVDNHITEKIGLGDLSKIAGYSPFYFSKQFSETMGMPPTGYIRIRKLQYAIVPLLEGQKVLDVALMYAFDSHEGFTRAFTKLFGSTPSTVRKYLTAYTVPEYVVPNGKNREVNRAMKHENDLQHNMNQLVFEVLKESLEEARKGFCTQMEVTFLSDDVVKISDNGRGLPLSDDLHASKEVLDKILAGRPVTNAQYSQMGDLIQSGMQTVNSLCESLHISATRNNHRFEQDYVRGVAQHEIIVSESSGKSGTSVVLKPDQAIFGSTVFSRKEIVDWLTEKAADLPGLTVKFSHDA